MTNTVPASAGMTALLYSLAMHQGEIMKRHVTQLVALLATMTLVSGCNTSHPTGSATGALAGATIGAGAMSLLHGTRTMNILAGAAGAAVGYYVTTLRYDSGGVMTGGGQVYQVGDQIAINIPADNLFEPNTADFVPSAIPILDSAADILARYPNNNIIISGNTSGFYSSRWEQKLSEKRAQRVAAYMWNAGINPFKEASNDTRKLTYVGYGDFLPISNTYSNTGIRQNNHIQITSYPSQCDLRKDGRHMALRNDGAMDDEDLSNAPSDCKPKDNDDYRSFYKS
jgi:outer membrane protein OmpA-like peptidoglycan-associated protein